MLDFVGTGHNALVDVLCHKYTIVSKSLSDHFWSVKDIVAECVFQ